MIWRKLFGKASPPEPAPREPAGPVEVGEIMFVSGEGGMLNTDGGQALKFEVSTCVGFTPREGGRVSIDRVDGMHAWGLRALPTPPAPVRPVVRAETVDAVLRAATPSAAPLDAPAVQAKLRDIAWSQVFTAVERTAPGLSLQAMVEGLHALTRPFERAEVVEILSFDPRGAPSRLDNPLQRVGTRWPGAWLSLLAWSNGGAFVSGERCFYDLLSLAEVREYTTLYGLVTHLPGAIPFALDGDGGLYVFDARDGQGELPVALIDGDDVERGWSEAMTLEPSFLEVCRARTRPGEVE